MPWFVENKGSDDSDYQSGETSPNMKPSLNTAIHYLKGCEDR